jgi:hypothetical protein
VLVQGGDQRVGLRRRPGPDGLLDEVEEALDALRIGPPGHGIDTRPAAHPSDHASVPPIDRLSEAAFDALRLVRHAPATPSRASATSRGQRAAKR